jgi:hypothetical protein
MGKLGTRSGVRYTSSWCQLKEYHQLFMYMCVLRIIVEGHGDTCSIVRYKIRSPQTQLPSKFFYPLQLARKKRQLSRMSKEFLCTILLRIFVRNMGTRSGVLRYTSS